MITVKKEWCSKRLDPDEEYLKAQWQAEIKSLEQSFAQQRALTQRRQASVEPLLKASGLSTEDIKRKLKENADRSRKSFEETEKQLAKPTLDIEALHKQDLELAKANAERIKGGNPSWSGYIWDADRGDSWKDFNGESEEIPSATISASSNRFDPRAQAWGEGSSDSDFSEIHAFLAFTFRPPSWGHLHIHVHPWLHGYYQLYSDWGFWWSFEYAYALLQTWVDVHQTFWRPMQYRNRFSMAGLELHPERHGRIDRQYSHYYYTDVGETDTVTIRVGARLYCVAQASGGRSRLNFQAGASNYVYVPYVYWYLHH